MDKQHFIPKHKDEYLPKIIDEMLSSGRIQRVYPWNNSILFVEKRYFRKLKIQNIENKLTGDDKKLLDILIDEKFTHLLTPSEYKQRTAAGYHSSSGYSGTWGSAGSAGVSGTSGVSGVGGYNTTGNYNGYNSTITVTTAGSYSTVVTI